MIKLFTVFAPILLMLACSNKAENEPSDLPRLKKQLTEELKAITETYSNDNHGFIYTLFQNDTAQLQVVHPSYIPELKTSMEFGLAIALAFDETFPGEHERHEQFKKSTHFSKFTAYEWEGIPCYGIDMKTDIEATIILLEDLAMELYAFNEFTPFSTDFYDQGPLLKND